MLFVCQAILSNKYSSHLVLSLLIKSSGVSSSVLSMTCFSSQFFLARSRMPKIIFFCA